MLCFIDCNNHLLPMFFSSDVTVVQINTVLDMETAALYNQTQTLPPLPPFPLSFSQWFSLLSG